MFLKLTHKKGPSSAVQGAISNWSSEFKWTISKGNNQATYLDFLKAIRPWIRRPEKTLIVLDNATYHDAVIVRKWLNEQGIS